MQWIRELAPAETDDEHATRALLRIAEELSDAGSWAWHVDDDEIVWSQNMFRIFELDPQKDKPSLQETLSRVHPDDRERLARALDRSRAGNPPDEIYYRVVTKSGGVKFLHAALAARSAPDGRLVFVGWLRDLTDSRGVEREIAAHIAVSSTLGAWEVFEEGAERLLSELATALGFSCGVLWAPSHGTLAPRVVWCGDREFLGIAREARRLRLVRGRGLAGRAWQSRQPVTLEDAGDDDAYEFQHAAHLHGLRGSLAIPLVSRDEVVGVIGLTGREQVRMTERLQATLTGIGHQIGAFLSRRASDVGGSVLSRREVEILELASQGLSSAEIAERLVISPLTVKSHFENIYAKYDVSDRVAAVAKALRTGLIE